LDFTAEAPRTQRTAFFYQLLTLAFLCVLCVLSEAGGSPREIIPIKIGIDLRSFHWVKIAFLPTYFIKDPKKQGIKMFFCKIG
jgi:hypothetical protein